MLANRLYYLTKPLIPRRMQIALRRMLVRHQLKQCREVWPIDPKAAKAPENWQSWPDKKQFALVLTHDVDTAQGQERCRKLMDLEKDIGFQSSFNFVPERYKVSEILREDLTKNGFEVGVHGLYHDGKYFLSRKEFQQRAERINNYLKAWQAVGYRSPSMQHNLEWFHDLEIKYDASTFDTDPFEPQPDGVGTIYPFWVIGQNGEKGYVELPYTMPQDFTLFVLIGVRDIAIWKSKLDWIAQNGGMVLLNTHPDYMNFSNGTRGLEEYPSYYYEELLKYIKTRYNGRYWHVLPNKMAEFWAGKYRRI